MDRTTARLWALCFGNFVIGTGALIVPGMLPVLAEGLGVSVPLAGQVIAAFAISVCIGAPILAAVTSRFDRRTLLVSTLLLYFAGHLAAALVSSLPGMLAVRVATSFGAALYTAQAAAVAALLVPAEQRGRAIAFVFLGWSVASVAGVPLGAYIGATLGWRAGFALVAVAAAAAAVAVWLSIPSGLHVKPADAAMWRAILRNRSLLAVLAVTGLYMAAGFALFSFFVPAAHVFVGASPELVAALLAGFGIAGVAGNAVAARIMDRVGAVNVAAACFAVMALGHLAWPAAQGSIAVLAAALLLSGLGTFAANSAQQARLVAMAPAQAPVSIALNTSAVFLGQAAGTAAAGALIAHHAGSAGFAAIPYLSVPLLSAALVLSLVASHKMRSHFGSAHVQGRPAQG